jgi:hypothetical protein
LFGVNESGKHHTLLQVRIEVQLGKRGDNDAKRLALPQWSDIQAIKWLFGTPYAWSVYSSKAGRNGL